LSITLEKILAGELGAAGGDEREILARQHLAALDGPLACERIVDVCERIIDGQLERSKPDLLDRLTGYCMATMRTLKRKIKAQFPRARNKPEFHRHRYPELSFEEMRVRVSRLQNVLGYSEKLKVEQIHHKFFRVCKGSSLDT
jgi:hypothetical protein